MIKLKIGQEFVIAEDFETKTCLSKTTVIVKKGTKGIVDSRKFIRLLSREHYGKMLPLGEDFTLEGYDTENIAKQIYERLKNQYNIDEFLDGYDTDPKEVIEEIDDVLDDIF